MSDKRIYFIYDGQKHVKIGISGNPKARLASLQTGTALKLMFMFSVPGTQQDETYMHEMFSDARAVGEWFRLDGPGGMRPFLLYVAWAGEGNDITETYLDWCDHEALAHQYGGFLYNKNEWADCVQVSS